MNPRREQARAESSVKGFSQEQHVAHWVYQYDWLGQVTNGARYWNDGTPVAGQQYQYQFDTIGNRLSTRSGGDTNGANLRPANYSVNRLNQITQRDVPDAE